MTITHINPATLHTNPAFSQGVLVEGGRTLYIGEQNGTDADGIISGDFATQTRQALQNVLAAYNDAPYVSVWLDTLFGQNVGNALNVAVVDLLAGQGSAEDIVTAVNDAANKS